ncbi:hypothetical protein [Amycolatopsis thermalba]|uniref:hypothetical protein n=1 Tax=Amycolatopsis thermalba TaxID=944492 RepID=UPI000E22BAE9|nr:hypothetical protein [Amycolatopsis thermalba]
MRQVFAHDAVLGMAPGADERAPGAAVTVALCGHWEHEPPCPLAPHHVRAEELGDELHVRVLFAAEPGAEREVRHRIDRALSERWQVRASRASDVSPAEAGHAERLVRG